MFGDLKMKIKEITEGKIGSFVKGFAQGLLPQQMQNLRLGKPKVDGPYKTADELYGAYIDPEALARAQQIANQPPAPLPPDVDTATNIPAGHRLVVQNPQGNATFYKYPNGQWTDEYGTSMPTSAHEALNRFADAAGRMEKIPTPSKSGKAGVQGFKKGGRGSRA